MEDEHSEEKTEEKSVENSSGSSVNDKQLKWVVVGSVIVILAFLVGYYAIGSMRHFDYMGIDFKVAHEGNIIFYNTFIPVYSPTTGSFIADYNIYFRNDPRKLESVPFDAEINLLPDMVIESSEDFSCNGYGVIAVANFAKVFELIGTKAIKDENATCDPQGRYMFVKLQEGNETSVEQFGPACYNININNCEILKGTEKFIIESMIKKNRG